MMTRVRLRGKSIGQIDEDILDLYEKITNYDSFLQEIERIIEEKILGYKVKNRKDLDIAEDYIKNLYYRNIGEYISEYMQQVIRPYIPICQNCIKVSCPKKKHPFQKGCSDMEINVNY